MMQSLPSLSQMLLPPPKVVVVGGATGIGRLSVDATRELAKCANGELVSHDVVRDGIDALLQLKRAPFDLEAKIQHQESSANRATVFGEGKGVLRIRPEGKPYSCITPWSGYRGVKDEESSDEEEEEVDDCS